MVEQQLPVVQTAGLCKVFRDFWRRPRVEAVKDLNLEIRPGEVFGLLGPNGSGKTTTIKMLLGLLYPTRGRISLFGKSPSDVSVKARIGFLPEESYLYRFLVAHETLDYYGRLFRLPARVRKERADRLLDMVGLRHEAKRPIGEYSKGMARRIGLAQALMNDPEFLILDEPTSGLDPIGARQIKDVIRALGRKGKTILLSSHMLADVEDVCDRVTILYGGQQRAIGEVGDQLRQRDVTQITAPSLSPETLDEVKKLVSRLEKRDILEVSHPRVKLEDFFMKIVEEAQAANIKTSGARQGGAVPEFLEKATAATTDQVIEGLVEASAHNTEPVAAIAQPIIDPKAEAAKNVLNNLLGGGDTEEESPKKDVSQEAPKEPVAPAPKVAADQSVLDALMGDDDGKPPAESSDKS
jgi:ABC-2 type transport system ATP-binding protein